MKTLIDSNQGFPRKRLVSTITKILGIISVAVAVVGASGCSDSGGGSSTTGSTSSSTGNTTTSTGNTTNNTTGNTPGLDTNDPSAIVSAADFGDEFNADSLSSWTLRHQAEGEAAQYTVLDINQTNAGSLTVQPTITPGWFAAGKAPLIYKRVTGNFSVETSVITHSAANAALPPGNDFNSAGLMARHTIGSGQNHVMVNVGRQRNTITNSLGSEAKNTTNSSSVLDLQSGSANGRLALCRVGDVFTVYRQLDNETQWTQIGIAVSRPDFPDTVQVGLVVNGFEGPDIVAEFDYVRMTVPANTAACVN